MRILYIGDIMASPGRQVVKKVLPQMRRELQPDVIIAQAENVSHGKSMSPAHMQELQQTGISVFTGGNHTVKRPDLHDILANPAQPVLCPANLEEYPQAWGVKEFHLPEKGAYAGQKILVMSLLGKTFPKAMAIRNPLRAFDELMSRYHLADYAAIVANFHGDFSSEKRVIGYYADGRVSAMVGDHWHVPTADAMVLPKGTAHITDVGMCGTLHSSLGVELGMITKRWRDEVTTPNRIAEKGPFQFNAVLIETDDATHLATRVQPVQRIVEKIS